MALRLRLFSLFILFNGASFHSSLLFSKMLSNATRQLIHVASDNSTSAEEFQDATANFFSHVGAASSEEVGAAIAELATSFGMEDPRRVAILGLICGALAEDGHNTSLFAKPLLDRFTSVLHQAVHIVEEIEPKLPPIAEGDDDEEAGDDDRDIPDENIDDDFDDDEDSIDEDDGAALREKQFAQELRDLGDDWQAEKNAWSSLEQFWPPIILALSLDPSLRRQYAFLARESAQIAEFNIAGYWVRTLLSVLDDEPIVVIEPKTKTGILARMSGVVDNFQLHMLLMDVFPNASFFNRRRISKELAELARGIGPQSLEQTVTGAWNLYDWRAVQGNLQLPDATQLESVAYWIWNEGTPADIPTLNGRRVILLGPPTYQRQWGAVRTFERLPAEIVIERPLNRNEVKEWLEQMKSTDR